MKNKNSPQLKGQAAVNKNTFDSYSTAYIRSFRRAVLSMTIFPVLILTLSAGVFLTSLKDNGTEAAAGSLQYGIVTGRDTVGGTNGAATLGMHLARFYEKDRNSPATAWDSEVLNAVKKGVEPIILIDDDNMGRTTDGGSAAAAVAARFGPGGTFWQNGQPGAGYGQYAPRWIEWGNETSYSYNTKPGLEAGDEYGRSAKAAAQAMRLANPNMGLIIQGESGGSGGTRWFDLMFGAVPDINSWVAGWTVHPYGPGTSKMDHMVGEMNRKGIGNSLIFITEDGPSTDNGATLTDNYGWSVNLTYAQAATAIQDKINLIKSKSYASRIRTYLQFQAYDQKPSGTGEREHYFGVYKNNGTEKGNYTSTVRTLASQNPRDGTPVSPPVIPPTPSTPPPTPPTPPAPSPSYNFMIAGQTMKWSSVPGATAYKVYLADTKTYINLGSATTSYVVPAPASGTERRVGWTWFDGQDHWVAEQTVSFAVITPTTPINTTPTPTPTTNPSVPSVVVTRPSDPVPLVIVPGAGSSGLVDIPKNLEVNKDGQITADFNGDGLNDLAFDLDKDNKIDPNTEIIVSGNDEPNLTNKNIDPVYSSLSNIPTLELKEESYSNVVLSLGPIGKATLPKPLAFSFIAVQAFAVSGIGAYFAITKLSWLASFRLKIGL